MNKHPEINGLRTWIEIDKKAIAHNYKLLRGLLSPETKFMAVVKSNAYGHCLIDFSKEIEKLGADWLGVDSIVEAEALRRDGIKLPILVLGYTLPDKIEAAVENISITVSTFEALEFISKFKGKLSIHIKVDTGMHRQGFQAYQIPEVISKLKSLPKNISVDGLFTHLAAEKDPAKPETALAQLKEFEAWKSAFIENNFKSIFHVAAAAGAMLFPQSHFDMVRFGGVLFGIWPSSKTKDFLEKKIPLMPILSWKTVISEVKKVAKGESVGYDFTETLKRDSVLAVCPMGYWHGFPRALSCVGEVLVNGKRARVVGRVSMDMFVIDVTDIPGAKVSDVVTVVGRDEGDEIAVAEMAKHANTSEYEIVTRLNPLIKRIFV